MKIARIVSIGIGLCAVALSPLNIQAKPGNGKPFQDLQDQIDQVAQDQTTGVQSLQDQLDQEVQDRADGDQSLQDQLDQEVQDRADGDQSIREEMAQLWGWISRSSLYTRSSESVDCEDRMCFVSVECDTPCDIPFHGYCTNTASLGKFELTSEGFTGLSGSSAMPGYSCVGETVDGFSNLKANVVCLQSPFICVY